MNAGRGTCAPDIWIRNHDNPGFQPRNSRSAKNYVLNKCATMHCQAQSNLSRCRAQQRCADAARWQFASSAGQQGQHSSQIRPDLRVGAPALAAGTSLPDVGLCDVEPLTARARGRKGLRARARSGRAVHELAGVEELGLRGHSWFKRHKGPRGCSSCVSVVLRALPAYNQGVLYCLKHGPSHEQALKIGRPSSPRGHSGCRQCTSQLSSPGGPLATRCWVCLSLALAPVSVGLASSAAHWRSRIAGQSRAAHSCNALSAGWAAAADLPCWRPWACTGHDITRGQSCPASQPGAGIGARLSTGYG